MLAGLVARRRVAEIGTGCGVGAAWIVSALDPGVTFVTVERDASLAAAAAQVFARDQNVRVLAGDWRDLLEPESPFDLVFVAAPPPRDDVEAVLRLLAPRGLAVVDDFAADGSGTDPRRGAWLGHRKIVAHMVMTTPATSAILAARRS